MDTQNQNRPDIEAIRARLTADDAPQFWRGLNELAETEEFRQYIEDEFPNRADLMKTMDRRQFRAVGRSGICKRPGGICPLPLSLFSQASPWSQEVGRGRKCRRHGTSAPRSGDP